MNNLIVHERLLDILPAKSFYLHSFPITLILITAMVVLLVGVIRSNPAKPNFPAFGISLVSISAILLFLFLPFIPWHNTYLKNAFIADSLTRYGMCAIALGTLITLVLTSCTNIGRFLLRPEFAFLLLISAAGLMVIVSAGEFLTFFIGIEMASIPLYVMVGFQRRCNYSLEAAIKYFILGGVASSFILFGMALIYMHTGSLAWNSLSNLYLSADYPFAIIGIVLFFFGISFKLALAPLHNWAPDVYEGSYSLLTGFMAAMVKLAMVLAILRILSAGIHDYLGVLQYFFWITGACSMVIGSVYGLVQKSVKRLLAYSSIANAGYFCLGFISLAKDSHNLLAYQAIIAYTGIYALLALGSFGVLAWLEEGGGENFSRDSLMGLGKKNPIAAFLFTIFLLGLAGIPPLAGFLGKLWLINAAVSSGFVGLAIVMVLFSVISLYYYLTLISYMWFFNTTDAYPMGVLHPRALPYMKFSLVILAAISLIIGIIGPRWAWFS